MVIRAGGSWAPTRPARGPEAGQSPAAPQPRPPPGSLPPSLGLHQRARRAGHFPRRKCAQAPGAWRPASPTRLGRRGFRPWTPFPGTTGSRGLGFGACRPLVLPRPNSCCPGPTQRSHTHPVSLLSSPAAGADPRPHQSQPGCSGSPGPPGCCAPVSWELHLLQERRTVAILAPASWGK